MRGDSRILTVFLDNTYCKLQQPSVIDAALPTRSSGDAYNGLSPDFLFFSCSISVESSESIGLKFGHKAWIGPEGDNKDFHRDSFCSLLIKNKKPQ